MEQLKKSVRKTRLKKSAHKQTKMKKYKVGFQIGGLILFLLVMLPNFYWFAVPAPHDILRAESVTPTLDGIASVAQVLLVIALCILVNRDSERIGIRPLVIAAVICCLLYYAGWACYYQGITNAVVVLDLCLAPCLAFLFFSLDRKNAIAVIPLLIFAVCHTMYGIINFILP